MINHVSKEENKLAFTARQLAFCAVSIALAFVLSNVKIFKFPTGGSITAFSMLVAVLPGFFFGPFVGIAAGVAYGILNLIVDPYILFKRWDELIELTLLITTFGTIS